MKKVLKVIGNVVLWLFVAFAVVVTILVFSSQQNDSGLPTLMGKRMVSILSDSMKPTFKAGDLILVRAVTNQESHDLPIGTVITYYVDLNDDGNDEINTHRIVSTYEENGYTYYVTQGDNNSAKDIPVMSNKIIGIYEGTKLGSAGAVMNFLQSPTGFLCIIVLPLVLFFLFELYNFISVITAMKHKKASAEETERIKQEAIEEYMRRQAEEKQGLDSAKTPDGTEKQDEK